MRAAIIACLVLAAGAGCSTARQIETRAAPIGKELVLLLPDKPGFSEGLIATQTIVAQYGERRTAFQANLTLTPEKAQVALTTAGGPRILTITWTSSGIVEERTAFAPEDLKGVNVLADIFVSLWPAKAVQEALPSGVSVFDNAGLRTIRSDDRVIVTVELVEKSSSSWRQKLTNFDFGYSLTIITEPAT